MPFHRGDHPGAVAVSYSTSMVPLSPSRRYSSSSNSTSGIGSTTTTTKFNSYRSPSGLLERTSYTTTSSTFQLQPKRVHCSPVRSASSYNDTNSIFTSGISGQPKYLSTSTSSASSTVSSSSSSPLLSTRDRNRLTPISSLSSDEFYQKYSPKNYEPNIHRSSNNTIVNGHSKSYPPISLSPSSVLSELPGGDERDSINCEHRDRSYSNDTGVSDSWSLVPTTTTASLRQTKRRSSPQNNTSLIIGTGQNDDKNEGNEGTTTNRVEGNLLENEENIKLTNEVKGDSEFGLNDNIVTVDNGFVACENNHPVSHDTLDDNSFRLNELPLNYGDDSKPSTSRRNNFFAWDDKIDDNTNASTSSSNNSTTPVGVHQTIYRGLNDSLEENATGRSARSKISGRRDDNYGLNGLRNIGNTCFMNSVIQCLSNTRPLLEYLLNDQYLNDINTTTSSMKSALIKAFAQVIHELWESSGERVVNTTALKTQIQKFAPRFMGYAQQDAQEFLRYLLEGLHEDVNRVTSKPSPILSDIPDHFSDSHKAAESWKRYLHSENSTIVDYFVGQLRSSLHCTSCDHESVTLDPFWDLSLPIPTRNGTVKLNQCLEHFTKVETLDGDEKPTCSKCQMRRKCTKSFRIQKFPKILVIHLKRFSPTERFRSKLSVLVDFPLTGLDLSAFAAPGVQGCTYNLYGVANHSGTPYSGHYTAYCKHPYSSDWHEYNDSRVTTVSASSVVSSEAYVLFYEQQQPLIPHL